MVNGKFEVSHLNGEAEGFYRSWHENGQQWAEGNYINDKQEGLWRIWDK